MRLRLSTVLAVSGIGCAVLSSSPVMFAAPDGASSGNVPAFGNVACQHDVAVSWHVEKAACQKTLDTQLAEFDAKAQSVLDSTPAMDDATVELKVLNERRASLRKDYRECVSRATVTALDQYRRCTPPVVAVP